MNNWSKLLQQVSTIEVKSITDPLFKYAIIILSIGAISSTVTKYSWIPIVLIIIGILLLLVALFFYCFFAFKNPDYLRSESFQIKKQSIEMLGDKDTKLNAKEIVDIASPYSLQDLSTTEDDFKNNKLG